MAIGVVSDPTSRLTASGSISNATCWSHEALTSTEISFKPVSKWRLLRRVFNCTRIFRDVGREAKNLRVRYMVDLQFTSIVMQDLGGSSKPSATDTTLPILNIQAAAAAPHSVVHKPHQSCKASQSSMQGLIIPLVVFRRPDCKQQSIFAVVASAVVFLSFECIQYPASDHVDWGGVWETNLYLFGSQIEFKNKCISIVTLFQAASILLFQAAYFWLKFREAALCSGGRKRKLSELEGVRTNCDEDGDEYSLRGVYARPAKDRYGNVVGYRYEPRFKPPRERNGRSVQSFQNLSLGSYSDRRDAEIVRQIAAFYYGMDAELVSLGDGSVFRIPAMPPLGLVGFEKAKWVSDRAKEVFEVYCKLRNNTTFTTQCLQSDGLQVHEHLNVGGEAIRVADASPSRPPNFNQALPHPTEQLSPMPSFPEFFLEHLEDVAALRNTPVVELHQSEDSEIDLAYSQLPPLSAFANPAVLDFSTPCNTTLYDQSLEPAGVQCLSNDIEFESSEEGAAISCNWGLDALAGAAPVYDSHYTDYSEFPALSPQKGANDVTPSQLLTSFCSKNCITDLLVKVVSLQQRQIKELEREVERLKGASQWKR